MRIFTAMLILFANVIYGQENIDFDYSRDYKAILSLTKSDTSKIYYPKLFQRFVAGDSTLTNYEVLALQIGYTDNDNYWPYEDIGMERDIWSLNEQKEFENAVKACDTLLNRNPFNILACREKSYAYNKLGLKDSADYYFDRFDKIVRCDLATGDGKSYETSWFVISPADGQWIIELAFHGNICFMGSGRDKNRNFHDILGFQRDEEDKQPKKKKKDDDCLNLYFNIEHAANRMFGKEGMKQMEELLKENKD